MQSPTDHHLDPAPILQTATAFWASKVLLTAVEFDLFSVLGDRSMTGTELGDVLGLHPRGRYDFFDALVALRFLARDGDAKEGRYKNTPETSAWHTRNVERPPVRLLEQSGRGAQPGQP